MTCLDVVIIVAELCRKRHNKVTKNAGIINRNRNNSASCTDNKRITLKISEIREMAI